MLREMMQLEDNNQEQMALYVGQKSEFTAGLCMLKDQIDNVLQKDDDHQQTMGLTAIKTPKFYPSGQDLWAEMPVDIRMASEEHEECMKSINEIRKSKEPKHTGVRKTSKSKEQHQILSTTSAFHQVQRAMSKDHKALPVLKEKECQEVIKMAANF